MNVVDSCAWLAYFLDDPGADFFAPAIEDTAQLLVPGIVVYEVSKRLAQLHGQAWVDKSLAYFKLGRFVHLDMTAYSQAALAAQLYKLHMADALIWQTAQTHGATLYTQDAALADLPGVRYQAKP
jgi:toxin FitB